MICGPVRNAVTVGLSEQVVDEVPGWGGVSKSFRIERSYDVGAGLRGLILEMQLRVGEQLAGRSGIVLIHREAIESQRILDQVPVSGCGQRARSRKGVLCHRVEPDSTGRLLVVFVGCRSLRNSWASSGISPATALP